MYIWVHGELLLCVGAYKGLATHSEGLKGSFCSMPRSWECVVTENIKLNPPPLRKFHFSVILSFRKLGFWNPPPPWNFRKPSLGWAWIFSGTAQYVPWKLKLWWCTELLIKQSRFKSWLLVHCIVLLSKTLNSKSPWPLFTQVYKSKGWSNPVMDLHPI